MLFLLLIPAWLIDLTGNLKKGKRGEEQLLEKTEKTVKESKKIKKKNQKSPRLQIYLIAFSAKLY
jgi:hypothetical protein